MNEILAAKREALAKRKLRTPIEAVRALASMQRRPQPILSTVTEDSAALLIGQIQRRPDSQSVQTPYDPVGQALRAVREGVDAINLFTDYPHSDPIYEGGLNDLALVARAVRCPVISQDYLFDEYQVVEARAAGASALFLHAGVVDDATLRSLVSATQRNRMTAIVHIHNEDQLRYALTFAPQVIAIGGDDPLMRLNGTLLNTLTELRACIPRPTHVLLAHPLTALDEAAAVRSLHVDAVLVDNLLISQPSAALRLRHVLTT